MPTKPMADAIMTLSQQLFRPPQPVAPGGPALPERLPEDDTNPFMVLMDAIRGATYGAEDSRAAKFGALMSAMAPVVGGPMAAMKGARAAKAAEGAGAEAVQGIRAHHGSAADFEQFDPRRIGSGEGAASYGYGHYFAEEPQVAESYRKQLSGRAAHGSFDRYPIAAVPYIRGVVGDIADGRLTAEQGAQAIYNANATMRNYPPAQLASELSDIAQTTKGRMYDVHIKADPAQFLSWDQPLSQQSPQVQQALHTLLGDSLEGTPLGKEMYQKLQTRVQFGEVPSALGSSGNSREAAAAGTSRELARAGIPGIKYLDQGSRTAGEGTRNYVMFPGTEDLIDILRKYGIPAALAASLAKYAQQPQGAQPQPQ